ncbi:MAG: branched-chain amino acid ABC transporter permease [Anaerolineaceae bacterium]|nr:branched-chain amino acid ABC transporter permease [Anaerolineaceae bacterium]
MSANIRPSGIFDTTYAQDISINRTRGDKILANGLFIILLLLPLVSDAGPLGLSIIPEALLGTINTIAILIIAVQGLNLLVGYTGQISLGHAAFMAVGAYSAAILGRELGMTFWLALPLSALITGVVGLIFGLPSLRVKGFYLAMATLAAQFIIPWILQYPLADITNGTRPLPVPIPELGPLTFSGDVEMYYIIVPLSVFLMLAARNIIRTRTGRAFISVRDNDLAAEQLGINVFWYKLQAFFLSALYAGVAGALFAYETNSLSLQQFQLSKSIEFLAMLIIGGAGFPLGAMFGTGFVILLQQNIIPLVAPWFRETLPQLLPFVDSVNIVAAVNPTLFGLVLITFLIIEPRGLAHRWEILKISWKLRPYSH